MNHPRSERQHRNGDARVGRAKKPRGISLLHPAGESILRVDSDTGLTRGYGESDVFGGHQVKAARTFIMRHGDDERGSPVVEDVFALAHETNAFENFV